MPKKVDHHARRTLIADALMRVAATQGLEAVSIRHVAAEAGVSTGMVQHYFRTKDEMMRFAIDVVADRVKERVAAGGHGDTPKAAVRAFLVQMLPLDRTRVMEAHVALAYQAYAAVQPAVERGRPKNEATRAHIARRIRDAHEHAGTKPPCDPDLAATTLIGLVEGLGVQVLRRHYPGGHALAALDAYLDYAFGP
ncbi:TetR/AcrR family transcriptional regulator [Sinosporangium siamense]|uniref:HTH tetR-type domain-containing protein n=1 Tax=Sinosporangium siamense TaxID=1367973 RepID=A0A919V8K7_9ACTN|nr:TetR/AcrR family transcriptional regulator [Sinosporangium siamense]GII94336.1 hypothetical protein Ssi02_45670 [Sinosporangium siamense]